MTVTSSTYRRGGVLVPKDPAIVAFGKRLRALRHAAAMSQVQLARAAGVHDTYIGQIERGERNLSLRNVLRLAHGLEVAPGALVDHLEISEP